ncbi:MAG: class I SAM-dependent methyltransferase [Thermostichus sp. DG02_5_bins_236]
MQLSPELSLPIPSPLGEAAYRTFQWSKNIFGFAHKALSTQASELVLSLLSDLQTLSSGKSIPPRARVGVSTATLQILRARYEQLLHTDWQDAEAGYYPHALLFDNPWLDFARRYPQVWLDLPQIAQRVHGKRYQEFSQDIPTEGYPKYYLQNFHYQTNGYLSDDSAELYDLQVELLFGGTADAMRRRVIRLLKDALDPTLTSPHILDVACGTGRTLRMLRGSLPKAALYGLDLSAAYLRKANQLLQQLPEELPQLLRANGEAMPYGDATFDAVTSVFLFHELPGSARQNVMNEMSRVVKPGGWLVICDSVQLLDSPELKETMEAFMHTFHEPYYRDYIRDDLGERLQQAGCEVVRRETHYVSTYILARKR